MANSPQQSQAGAGAGAGDQAFARQSVSRRKVSARFRHNRRAEAPALPEAEAAIRWQLAGRACAHRISQTLGRLSSPQLGWPMAYALSWSRLQVATR